MNTHQNKTVSNPQRTPPIRTFRKRQRLAVDSYHIGWSFANYTSRYIFSYILLFNRHHRNWKAGRQPVRFIVSASVITDVVVIAEQEWHGGEFTHARPCYTQILTVRLLVSFDVEQGISVPKFHMSGFTLRHFDALTVPDKQSSGKIVWGNVARCSGFSFRSSETLSSS